MKKNYSGLGGALDNGDRPLFYASPFVIPAFIIPAQAGIHSFPLFHTN
jgi:hypothetical protein